uniref:separase n=1 Tax=Cyprinodon variegatus TaxID=28743 RepID=A0A3Q2C729_CYPVA
MKCLKVEEYIKRTSSVEETTLFFSNEGPYNHGQHARQLYDRILRACNHQLGLGSCYFNHISELVRLVELALHAFYKSAEIVPQSGPLYMEKILFHIVKNLVSLGSHSLCRDLAGLLYNKLSLVHQVGEDYTVLVRSCFSVFWNALSAAKERKLPCPKENLHLQLQAGSFLLLLDSEPAGPAFSKSSAYMSDAISVFNSTCSPLTTEDASFLLKEMEAVFNRALACSQTCKGGVEKKALEMSRLYVISETMLLVVKSVCKAGHHSLAYTFLDEIEKKILNCIGSQWIPLVLGRWGVKIHSSLTAGKEGGQAFTECARILRALSAEVGHSECHAVLEGCNLVIWAVGSGRSKGLSGLELLALFSFLEEHQEWLIKMLNKVSATWQQAAKVPLLVPLPQLRVCQWEHGHITGNLLDFLKWQKLTAVSNMACGMYKKGLYEQAFTLVEIVCRAVCKYFPSQLSADRVKRALDWVILWLKALGDQITTHMAEPVSFWVKIKGDGALNNNEDLRLRTLRDGFGPDIPEEKVMLCLLDEELRAYKESTKDMAQERYNTLCDLLEICHEESSYSHLRAVYLCEMAQVVCFQDFSEQTDCMAVDFTHEALRLLDEEPETPENADRLKDDKAQALLWLYICTLEKNMQEVIHSFWMSSWHILTFLEMNVSLISEGVPYLCQVLKEVNNQKPSKSWYLLRAQTLQALSSYLNLDIVQLPQAQRSLIVQHGISSPDSSLYEALKLLCSLLVTLVGKGLYGNTSNNAEVHFIHQGDNLVVKWQLLSQLLSCSAKLVAVRRSSGAINDARLQCLEALKLAIKLQALNQYLLVVKSELELMQGEAEESRSNLDFVKTILEQDTVSVKVPHTPHQKDFSLATLPCRPAQRPQSPVPFMEDNLKEDDLKDFLKTRWTVKEVVLKSVGSSPPLKAPTLRWLSSLSHELGCQLPCCSEPCLGHASARWAATRADLSIQLEPNNLSIPSKLHWAALVRCKNVTRQLQEKLAQLFPDPARSSSKPSLMQDVEGRVYLSMAQTELQAKANKVCGLWKILEAAFAFLDSTVSPDLRPVRAHLMATKAMASLMVLAAKKGCRPEELFSNSWVWNTPKEHKGIKSEQKSAPPSKIKKPKASLKQPDIAEQKQESKKVNAVKPKIQVTSSSTKGKVHVPMTPVTAKSKSVEFSDESDSEAAPQAQCKGPDEVPKKQSSRRANAKKTVNPPAEKVAPKRQSNAKRNVTVPSLTSSEDEALLCKPAASGRRGRSRKQPSKTEDTLEEPDSMRTIVEETGEVLDISIEQLRTSDAEEEGNAAASKDNDLSFEDVQSLLRSALLTLQHFPCPIVYSNLCALLALTTGQSDPISTALLHAQSLGVTNRHRTIRHIYNSRHKLKKASSDLTEQMEALTVNESSGTASFTSTEQMLSQMEEIFSFPTADLGSFPQNLFQRIFTGLLLFCCSCTGVTVCLMSVLGVKPGEMGESIMLSRLEKDSAPITLHISTSRQQVCLIYLANNSLHNQKQLWEMESLLGCWKSLFLPPSLDPGLSKQAKELSKALLKRGVSVSEEMLKVCFSLLPCGSYFGQGEFEHKAGFMLLRHRTCLMLADLCVSQYLQKLPWESMSFLKSRSVSRMPSLHSLIRLNLQREMDSSILKSGVDLQKVFYVLDPDANLKNAQEHFKEWFASKPDWQGVCGVAPESRQLEEAVSSKDLYIYVGHGAGVRFLDSQAVLKQQMRAASLLFGCSSAALAVRGNQEGQVDGCDLNHKFSLCFLSSPFILGNLWDVTDRDMDRFTKVLLESWFCAGPGAPLLEFIDASRQATHLKYLNGAAPVVYGLPINLQ